MDKIKKARNSAILNGILGATSMVSSVIITAAAVKACDSIEDTDTKQIVAVISGGLIATGLINGVTSTVEMLIDIDNYKTYKGIRDNFVNGKEAK